MHKIKNFFSLIRFFYPLKFNGTLLLFISLILLGYAFGSWNLYALFFSLLGLVILIFFLIIGFFLKFKNTEETIILEVHKPIIARLTNQTATILSSIDSLPVFFRIHFALKGKFIVGRNCSFYSYFEKSFKPIKNNMYYPLEVYFPFCGIGDFLGYSNICDIFGFIKIPIKKSETYKIYVYPPLFPDKPILNILPSTTQESLRNIKSSEEEKYFMRQYIPGDRLKDINWKSSIKLNDLITKISPSSPEESQLIYIEIRPYHYHKKDGIEAILQLNYLKSWILSFINIMKKEHPKYKFHIFTGKDIFLIDTEEDIYHFSKKLIELNYMKEIPKWEQPPSFEKFIFSTSFDKHLASYISSLKSKIYLFRVVYGKNKKVPLFHLEIFYNIPGFWILRREKLDTNSPKPINGKLMEEKIKIRYI